MNSMKKGFKTSLEKNINFIKTLHYNIFTKKLLIFYLYTQSICVYVHVRRNSTIGQ